MFVSITYDLIHNISIKNDSEILAGFIYAVRNAKDIEELNSYIEKRIPSYSEHKCVRCSLLGSANGCRFQRKKETFGIGKGRS
jgi:hypothetical protein